MAEVILPAGQVIFSAGFNYGIQSLSGVALQDIFLIGEDVQVSGSPTNDGIYSVVGNGTNQIFVDGPLNAEVSIGDVTLTTIQPAAVIPDATFTLKIADTLSFTGQVADVVEFTGQVATRVEKTLTTTTQINFTGGV